jgi:hypothetical protein
MEYCALSSNEEDASWSTMKRRAIGDVLREFREVENYNGTPHEK